MVRIALVEDDESCRQELTGYLERYARESGEKFRITAFSDGAEIAEGYTADYDVILMDIVMTYMDGMKSAEAIRAVDSEVVIIFITSTPQYAMKGYTVDALDYILKPVSYFAFSQRIQRALERMRRRTKRYLPVPFKGGMKKLDISQLTYIEVRDHDLIYHTREEALEAKGSLSELEEALGRDHFFRCNKCYLVNLDHVDSVTDNSVTVGGELVQVSRARKKALLDALNDYINEAGK